MGMGGSSGSNQPTQTTTTQLGPEARALANLAFPGAYSFGASPLQRYPGSTVVGFTPEQLAGQEAVWQGAGNQQQVFNAGTAIQDALVGSLRGDVNTMSWDPNVNPHLRDAITAVQRPLYQNLMETVLPGIRDTGVTQGYGNSRQGIAEGLATGRTAQAAGDAGARLVAQLYGQNLDAQGQRYGQNINALLGASNLTPMLQNAAIQPGITMSNVGDVRNWMAGQYMDEALRNWNWDVNRTGDLAQAQELVNLMHGFPSSTVVTANNPSTGGSGSMLRNAMSGAAMGATLGSAFPVVGTGIGAIGGGLAGLLFS